MLRNTTAGSVRVPCTVALALAVLLGPLAAVGGAAGGVTSSSQLAPDLVTGGRTAFYAATWVNDGPSTLANTLAVITLPAGSSVLSATPAACTFAGVGSSEPVVVSCPYGNLPAGATVTQQLLVQTPGVALTTEAVVKAALKADEMTSDKEKAHTDTFPVRDRTVTLVPGAADAAGGCLSDGEAALSTRPGLGTANPLITTAGLTGSSGPACVPVTIREKARTSPTEGCAAGATCTTDIAFTEFIPISAPAPASPLQLSFTVVGTNKNMTWYKDGVPVAGCAGATSLPADLAACVNSRSKPSSNSVRLGVLWRAGPDPGWTG